MNTTSGDPSGSSSLFSTARLLREPALIVLGAYVLFAGAWILLSERLFRFLGGSKLSALYPAACKQWLFMALMAVVLTLTLIWYRRRFLQAQAALRQSERTVRAILDASTESILLGDGTGRIRLINTTGAARLGQRPEQLIGRSLGDLLAPEVAGPRIEKVRRVLNSRQPLRFEDQRDGIRFDHNVYPLRVGEQAEDLMVLFSRDVTRQKQAEEALRQSEEQLRLVIEAADLGMFNYEPRSGRRLWSQIAKRHLGLPEHAQISRDTLGQRLHPEDRERVLATLRGILDPGDSGQRTLEFRTVDLLNGRVRWLSGWARVYRDSAGEPIRAVGATLDVTETKLAEERLRETSRFNQQIISSVQAGLTVCGLDQKYRVWNPYMEQMTGCKAADVLGRAALDVFAFSRTSAVAEVWNKALAGAKTSALEVEYLIPATGARGWLSFTSGPLRNAAGQIIGIISNVREISRRKQREERLRQSESRLRALSARLENLREEERTRIAREIHDQLGQMLTALKMDLGWIEHRMDDFGNDVRVNPILDKLVTTVELVDSTISTVQRIASDLRPGLLDKLGLMTALQYEAARFQKRTGLTCQPVVPREEPRLAPAVATAFFRIFQEALTNIGRHAQATAVDVEFRSQGEDCLLEIKDNGKGIRQADLANPRALGLLSMQERARLLGGTVTFSLRLGGGTVVSVCIPGFPAEKVAK